MGGAEKRNTINVTSKLPKKEMGKERSIKTSVIPPLPMALTKEAKFLTRRCVFPLERFQSFSNFPVIPHHIMGFTVPHRYLKGTVESLQKIFAKCEALKVCLSFILGKLIEVVTLRIDQKPRSF